MSNNKGKDVRQELTSLLKGGNAHAGFEDAVANLKPEQYSTVPEGLPYSIWQLVEHIRLAQWDILDFSSNPDYKPMKWPDDYWPKETAPKDHKTWEDSLQQTRNDLKELIALINDEAKDLYEPFAWGEGQTLLREAMLVADHNAYHIAEIIVIRRLLKAWK